MSEYSLEIYGMFFDIEKHQKRKNDEHEKDARRELIAIRLINSSSTSVRNLHTKKHMIVKSVDVTTFFLFLGGRGVCDVTSPKPPLHPLQVTHVRSLNKKTLSMLQSWKLGSSNIPLLEARGLAGFAGLARLARLAGVAGRRIGTTKSNTLDALERSAD